MVAGAVVRIGLATIVIAVVGGVAVIRLRSTCDDPTAAVRLVAQVSAEDSASLAAGYQFLDEMLDQHATGSTLRLPQSYTGGFLQRDGFTDSVTYDDALIIDALLARGTPRDIARAKVLGNSLLFVQAHDTKSDGRIRAAYAPTPLTSAAKIQATDATSDVGNMAWVGQALVQLHVSSGGSAYLAGAVKLANWIQTNAYDTRGNGGYTGGIDDANAKITWKSTEHNLDILSFFTMLAGPTADPVWNRRAAWARQFAVSMYDSSQGRFWTGSDENGTSTYTGLMPEDAQSWSYLALKDRSLSKSLEYDMTHLAATDGAFKGVSFATADRSKVWFEGTAHLALALRIRNAAGDAAKAQTYLDNLALAQRSAPNNNGKGIVSASHDGLRTGDGDDMYFASLHTGTTAWYLLALQAANPFYPLKPARPALSKPPTPTLPDAGPVADADDCSE